MLVIYKIKNLYELLDNVLKLSIESFSPQVPIAENWSLWKRLVTIDARLYWTCFCGGIAISRGQDPLPLLAWLNNIVESRSFSIYISSYKMAEFLIRGVFFSTKTSHDEYHQVWQRLAKSIQLFSIALEKNTKRAWVVRRDNALIEKIILHDLVHSRPITIGNTYAVNLEVTQPIEDIWTSSQEQKLYCTVELEGRKLGILELPIVDGIVSCLVLKDAIAAKFAEQILASFLENEIYHDSTDEQKANNINSSKQSLVDRLAESKQFERQANLCFDWTLFLTELWGIPQITAELSTTENVSSSQIKSKKVPDLLTIEVSDQLQTIEVNTDVVDLIITVGGSAIGVITIVVSDKKLTPELLRSSIVANTEFELGIVAVREGLLGRSLREKVSLRERLAQSAAARSSKNNTHLKLPLTEFLSDSIAQVDQAVSSGENLLLLGRRHPGVIGTSASRWAMLPTAAIKELTNAASITGEPIVKIPQNEEPVKSIFYAPDLISASFPEWQQSLLTTNPDQLEIDSATSISTYTEKLPILMYHQVVSSNSAELERWQLAPEAFESQLRYLRDQGFYSITLEDWRIAIMQRKPLPGKAVLITFDDGYLDFFDCAFPLLKQYGFSATVFLIVDYVGSNYNNHKLMGWQQIKQLQAQGIEFGSHSATHPSLTTSAYEKVVQEGVRSRAILERELGVAIDALAYPYGDVNPLVEHLIGACGYTFGLSIGLKHSTVEDSWLKLSRIEVEGTDTLQRFASKLG